ncbi:MAG: DUF1501 domain-containing protein [Deltaproteobacteria bacterium]|nr:DUF1501 domain-containing protein [Deltaproteobacteria bacterium]
MGITRRQFLGRSGAAAGGFLGASLFGSPFAARALAESLGDRYLVVLFLDGGNDGLNTIIPAENGSIGSFRTHYEAARVSGGGGLRVAANQLLTPSTVSMIDPGTGGQLGFHPGLQGLRNLYEQGHVAVVQNCGYPNANLSHEESRRIWEYADPRRTGVTSGWIGRHLAANFGPAEIPGVAVRGSVPGEFAQTATSILTISSVSSARFPFDSSYGSDSPFRRNALMALAEAALASGQPTLGQVGAAGRSTLLASQSYPPLDDLYEDERPSFDAMYDGLGTSTAHDLREIAKVIYGVESGVENIEARYFELQSGGYDTHSDQGLPQPGNRHYDLHRQIGDAIETFYADCTDMGVADKVCLVVWSEFSRRILQNDSGTDHGTQGPMFVVGAVNGGVYGNHPDIDGDALDDGNTRYSQETGNPHRSTDIRDVYGTILKHWVNVPHQTILSSILPRDAGDPADFWTQENFDIGFL